MKTKKTYLELIKFNAVAGVYLEKNKESENKICVALKNVIKKQVVKHFENYNEEVDILQLNNCATDEKTRVILKDEKGNRQFTVEGELKLKKESKLLLAQTVEMHQRIPEGIDDLIAKLTDEEKEYFSGIVIPEQKTLEPEQKVVTKTKK